MDNEHYVINGTDFQQRFRYRFTVVYPINDKFYLKGFDEIWWNLNYNFMPSALNQNWLYGGFQCKINKKISADLGFMNQLIKKSDQIHYESNPTIQAAFSYNI